MLVKKHYVIIFKSLRNRLHLYYYGNNRKTFTYIMESSSSPPTSTSTTCLSDVCKVSSVLSLEEVSDNGDKSLSSLKKSNLGPMLIFLCLYSVLMNFRARPHLYCDLTSSHLGVTVSLILTAFFENVTTHLSGDTSVLCQSQSLKEPSCFSISFSGTSPSLE